MDTSALLAIYPSECLMNTGKNFRPKSLCGILTVVFERSFSSPPAADFVRRRRNENRAA